MTEKTLPNDNRQNINDTGSMLIDEHITIPTVIERISDLRRNAALPANSTLKTLQAVKTLKEFINYKNPLDLRTDDGTGITYRTVKDELYSCVNAILRNPVAEINTQKAVSDMAVDVILRGDEPEPSRMAQLVGSLYRVDNTWKMAHSIVGEVLRSADMHRRQTTIDAVKKAVSDGLLKNSAEIKNRLKQTIRESSHDVYIEFERHSTSF